ncbi:hypothetical protein A3H53_00260 [Candidatus Nomurabacteria bacterium RIFCSPLOWO2_02_FULL_40_10]|uniref:Uncharacterized protein n=1 Tax=Candidatus Nomurabacteria bacterium RIFCSPLOWO2_02_FULL_40_10 TaxID=1801786 RepID=A0A1F6Y136_9BACT|nr:MAG: hypothetical protein A3H53_00260 [Candidatus Nomurabacteria bacterium RIFCSPLOWO2_02_FULL_40_10]
MNVQNTPKNTEKNIERLQPKHYRTKFTLALAVLIIVFVGLYSQFFVAIGLFNYIADPPRVELDALRLERIGVDVDALENDIHRVVVSMNNAQQGTHFLSGAVAGFIFSQPTAGLTVGLLKEFVDLTGHYRAGTINKGYFIDTIVDVLFWFLGGFVGFYVLSAVHDFLHEHRIRGPRDLTVFVGKKSWKFLRRKK